VNFALRKTGFRRPPAALYCIEFAVYCAEMVYQQHKQLNAMQALNLSAEE